MHPTLDDLITNRGWGFTEFADATGLNRQNVHRIRSGRCLTLPHPPTLFLLAKTLGVSVLKVKNAIVESRREYARSLKAPSDCEV